MITIRYGLFNKLYNSLLDIGIMPIKFSNNSINNFSVRFLIKQCNLNKFQKLLETDLKTFSATFSNVTKLSIIGYGIINDNAVIFKILKILEINNLDPIDIEITDSKISLVFNEKMNNSILEQFHQELIKW